MGIDPFPNLLLCGTDPFSFEVVELQVFNPTCQWQVGVWRKILRKWNAVP